MSAKICQCCGGTGWEGSECSDLRAKLLELQCGNDRLREFIAALPAPLSSRHFEEFQPSPEMVAAWKGVDADKWLEELRGNGGGSVNAAKLCENCGDPATHTGSHLEAGGMLVCYPCTVGQPFSHLESLEERDKRVRKFLDATNTQAWDGVDPDKWLETLRGHDTPETEVDL